MMNHPKDEVVDLGRAPEAHLGLLRVHVDIDRRRVQRGEEPDWSDLPDDQASPLT